MAGTCESHLLHLEMQGTIRLTRVCPTDDCQLLLWHRIDANLRNGHNNADRIHAQAIVIRCGPKQSHSEHLLLWRWYCGRATDPSYRQWLAVYHFGSLGSQLVLGDMGDEEIWAALEEEDGEGVRE